MPGVIQYVSVKSSLWFAFCAETVHLAHSHKSVYLKLSLFFSSLCLLFFSLFYFLSVISIASANGIATRYIKVFLWFVVIGNADLNVVVEMSNVEVKLGKYSRLTVWIVCKSENKKRKSKRENLRERDPGKIIRVFCELMEMAAHKSPSLRKNSHLGRYL